MEANKSNNNSDSEIIKLLDNLVYAAVTLKARLTASRDSNSLGGISVPLANPPPASRSGNFEAVY